MQQKKCILASHNQGKLRELRQLLQELPLELIAQDAFHIAPVEEVGTTFVENALIKARHAVQQSGLPAIADDSGLSVDALQGAPGIHSARYAGKQASDAQRIEKLLAALASVPLEERTARFHCALVWVSEQPEVAPIVCEGTWSGYITQAPKGSQGFGYDPIFFVKDYHCTAAQLSPDIKQAISHRAQAMRLFQTALLKILKNIP